MRTRLGPRAPLTQTVSTVARRAVRRTCACLVLIAAAGIALPAAAQTCAPGTPPGTQFKGHPGAPPPFAVQGSFCENGAAGRGAWSSDAFTLGASLSLYLAGYPDAGTQRVWLRRADGALQRLVVFEEPGARWTQYYFDIPKRWRGAQARVELEDGGAGEQGWVAVSSAPAAAPPAPLGNAAPALLAGAYLLLILLPGLAVAALGRLDAISAWSAMLLFAPAAAYLAFWLVMLAPALGPAPLAALGLFSLLALALRRERAAALLADPRLWQPAVLTLAALLFAAAAAYLFNGFDEAVKVAGWRYSHKLPGDNYAPLLLAHGFVEGKIPPSMTHDWLSSDRPPLQAAFVVLFWPLTKLGVGGVEQHYQALSMALQNLWLPAAWLLLARWGVSPAGRSLALLACLCSNAVIVNTIYVWPKLMAAAYLLLAAALLLDRRGGETPRGPGEAAAGGAALAFAYLAHGGAAFGILAIVLLRVLRRPLPARRALGAAALAMVVLYAPWAAYQKLVDPPGNRLLKWYLAGAREVDPRGFAEAMGDAYRRPLPELLHNRAENLRALTGRPLRWLSDVYTLVSAREFDVRREAMTRVRGGQFFRLLESLLLLLPAGLLAALVDRLRRPRPPPGAGARDGEAARVLLALGLTGTAIWVLVLYGPATTLIHQGSYFLPIVLIAGAALQLWALSRALAAVLVGAWCALHVYLYWWLPPPLLWQPSSPDMLVGTRLPATPSLFNTVVMLTAAAALIAALALAARGDRE